MTLISVITVNLNNKPGLEKTIRSVIGQQQAVFEFLIVDGGSSDGSAELIAAHQEHLSWWVSEKDSGIYEAMNKGIKKAKGEYLLFLNSGDTLHNEEVLQCIKPWLERGADVISGSLELQSDTGLLIVPPQREVCIEYFRRISLYHQATFIRRDLFTRYGYYNESFRIGGDYEFFIRTLLRNNASYLSAEKIVVCHYDTTGISNKPEYLDQNLAEKERAWSLNFHPLVLRDLEELYTIKDSHFFWIINKTRRKNLFWYFFAGITAVFMFFYRVFGKLRLIK